MLSSSVIKVPRPVYRFVRQSAVPPRKPCASGAAGLLASILPVSVRNSASVMSLVQHFGDEPGPLYGTEHLLFRSVATMLVVVCRSHSAWRHTSAPSLVNVTSHSTMPAPIRAAASYDSCVCSGICSPAPRWPIEKSVRRNGPSAQRCNFDFRAPSSMPATR